MAYWFRSEESLRRSVDNVNKHLRGTKKLDLFECARVDPRVPIEESTRTLNTLIEEGKFAYIGMSETSSETLRKAQAVSTQAMRVLQSLTRGHRSTPSRPWRSNSAPGHTRTRRRKVCWYLVAMFGVVLTPLPTVIAAAEELGIAVVGYSPLGRGFLTGQIKSRDDIPTGDLRLRYDRFSEEVVNAHSDFHPVH